MKMNVLLSTTLILGTANAFAGGVSDPGQSLLDETKQVQAEKQGSIATTIGELGALTALSFPGQNSVNLIAFYERPLNPVLRQMKDEMAELGADVRNIRLDDEERHNTVIGYGSNLAQLTDAQKAVIMARAGELRSLPQDAQIGIHLGYTLSKNTSASIRRSIVSCSNRIVATFRYVVAEPTGILQNLVFETKKAQFGPIQGMVSPISDARVEVQGSVEEATQACLAQLK